MSTYITNFQGDTPDEALANAERSARAIFEHVTLKEAVINRIAVPAPGPYNPETIKVPGTAYVIKATYEVA